MSHILIVESRFYPDIADALAADATSTLELKGASWERVEVPGAFEAPAAIRFALDTGRYDGYVALGCVIRGETTHYDYVCAESARGLNELALQHGACVGYGILTVENEEQAWARVREGRKGAAAAEACLAMIHLKQHLHG